MLSEKTSCDLSLGIVGDGVMGWQIALLAASNGIDVNLIGRGIRKDKLRKKTEKFLGVESQKININFSNDLDSLKNKTIIIETLPENLNLKLKVIKSLTAFDKKIICTNTSSLELKKLLIEPHNICALHFINPVNSFNFVEFSSYPEFSVKKKIITKFLEIIGYDIYECPLLDGLIVNRLLFSYLDTIKKLSDKGINSDKCDQIFGRLTGAKINSKKIIKLIGKDVCNSIFANFKEKSFLP